MQRRGATGDDHVVIASQWATLALTSPRTREGRMGIQRWRHAGRVVVALIPSEVVDVLSISARNRTEQIKILTGHPGESPHGQRGWKGANSRPVGSIYLHVRVQNMPNMGEQGAPRLSLRVGGKRKGRDNAKATTGTGSRFEMGRVVRALQREMQRQLIRGAQRLDTNNRLAQMGVYQGHRACTKLGHPFRGLQSATAKLPGFILATCW